RMLGHKTMTMAQVYINLVQSDMLEVLDRIQPSSSVYSIAPLEGQDAATVQRRRRSERLAEAVAKKVLANESISQAATPVAVQASDVETETTGQASPEQALQASLSLDAPAQADAAVASSLPEDERLPENDAPKATGTDAAHPAAPRVA